MTEQASRLGAALADRYRIERELGAGGMATVYLAQDTRHDRRVAIKVLRPELAGAIGVDRFIREVRLTANLQHPNIVPVLDSGVLPAAADGPPLPWYAMPYIEGESLRARLNREHQLPVEDALHIAEEVARALETAHAQGIVHRDIKPENVILAGSSVYVVDFGIAKALIETGGEQLTSTGFAIGTPAYMSPEQASASPVDGRTDQYGLATMLYEMLAGSPPFTGPTAQAIIGRRFAESARAIRPVRPTVSIPLERAVLRGLERVPADRFADVRAFIAALRGAATADPRDPRPRGRLRLAIGALVVAALLAGGAWAFRHGRAGATAPPRDSVAVALYQRGVREYDRRTPAGITASIAAFTGAIQRDSAYGAAWTGLARTYVRAYERRFEVPGVPRDSILRLAVTAAQQALAADSGSAEAWLAQATVTRQINPTRPHAVAPCRAAVAPARFDERARVAAPRRQPGRVGRHERGDGRVPARGTGGPAVHAGRRVPDPRALLASPVRQRGGLGRQRRGLDPNYILGWGNVGYVAIERGDFARSRAAFDATRRLSTNVEVVERRDRDRPWPRRARGGRRRRGRCSGRRKRLPRRTSRALHTAVWHRPGVRRTRRSHPGGGLAPAVSAGGGPAFPAALRCDPRFDPLASDSRFRSLLRAGPRGTGVLTTRPRPSGSAPPAGSAWPARPPSAKRPSTPVTGPRAPPAARR